MEIRSAFFYDTKKASDETGLLCKDKSKAIQSQKEEADINTIVKRFGLTGELPQGIRMPQYGDFLHVTDYQSALNAVLLAEESFDQLPWELKKRFNNDPEEFVNFCVDGKNYEEAVKLGLVKEKAPAPKEAVTPATPAPVKQEPVK
ncbi:MAG: internal scaffolding protein [Microvirus sp.]|nr:MAG: internal scaffolding protein [Microvirus sp.]